MPSLQTSHCFFSGTSGVVLPVRNKESFPEKFKDKSRLAYYAHLFNSLEVNSSFYKIPLASTVARWADEVPEGFRFTFKLYRGVTHNKLLAFDEAVAGKFMQIISRVGIKKGCLLIQFPQSTKINLPQLKRLLACVANNNSGWRISVEFRDKSWYHDSVYTSLRRFNTGIVVHDMPGSATPELEQWTTHVYLRYHGEEGGYKGSYPLAFLEKEAGNIGEKLNNGKTVYAYFNNTMGDAVNNVASLNNYVQSFYSKPAI